MRQRRTGSTAVVLPAEGRQEPAPVSPLELGDAGNAWWAHAWATPQSTQWNQGDLFAVAHRARLEDELAGLGSDGSPASVRAVAGARARVLAGMGSLDDKLGLTPRGAAALRWTIEAPTDWSQSGKPRKRQRAKSRRAPAKEPHPDFHKLYVVPEEGHARTG